MYYVCHGLCFQSRSSVGREVVAQASNRRGIKWAIDEASGEGNLTMVQWLHTTQTGGCTTRAMDQAAQWGHLSVVKWLHANRTEGCTTEAMDHAARNGHLDVVKWLHTNRSEGCTSGAMDQAAKSGNLAMVQWLHANRTEGSTTGAMDDAAESARLNVVQWLHRNRHEGCTTGAMDCAAMKGHVSMVQWLDANRSEGCTTRAMTTAFQMSIVNTIFSRKELRSWPRPNDTPHLVELAQSTTASSLEKLIYVTRCRQERYCQEVLDNPVEYVETRSTQLIDRMDDQAHGDNSFLFITIVVVCTSKNLRGEIGKCISEYAFAQPDQVLDAGVMECPSRHWRLLYSIYPSRGMDGFDDEGEVY